MAEESESETPTLDEMRRQIAEVERLQMQEDAEAERERLAPYRELVESDELKTVLQKIMELRQVYIGDDETRFRKLDTAYMTLTNL